MYYRLSFDSIVEEYISIDDSEFEDIEMYCISSEFQYMNKKEITVYTSDNGGLMFTDFFYNNAVALFSERLYKMLLNNGVDNLFTKLVRVVSRATGKNKKYILALPPRIDCLDNEKSEYEEFSDDSFHSLKAVSRLVIDEKKVGGYKIFKLAGVMDNSIYVTDEVKECLKMLEPVGLSFYGV